MSGIVKRTTGIRRPTLLRDIDMDWIRLSHVMQEVASDCEADAIKLDGKPFDGRTVAATFGEMLAMIRAVAMGVEAIAKEFAADELREGD